MTKTVAYGTPPRPCLPDPGLGAGRHRLRDSRTAIVDRRYRLLLVFACASWLGLDACTWPTIYRDHQVLRVRVVRIWTSQEMAEDWEANLRLLANTPPLETYLSEYRRQSVFLANIGRNNRYEYSLAPSRMRLVAGDIIEIDIGTPTHAPRVFEDLPMVKAVVCRVTDVECLGDPKRGATLGVIKD